MHHRKLGTTLAILATTAGVSVFAGNAQAVVVDNDGFGLTGDSEVSLTDANIAFDWTGGQMIPRLTGTLNADNADDPGHHGTPEQREAAWRDGFDSGDPSSCDRHLSTAAS